MLHGPWIIALLSVVLSLPSGHELGTCRFRDVVPIPDGGPAVLDRNTWRPPDLSNLLLSAERATMKAWLRISADGRVTDVCIPNAPDGFPERIADVVWALRYMPARHRGRSVATVVVMRYDIGGRFDRQHKSLSEIGTSNNVAWLERIAESVETASEIWRSQSPPVGQPKDLRVAAFARLGELGTAESLAAQKRIAARFASRPMIPAGMSLTGAWTHPGWHMGDYCPVPLARIRTVEGSRIVIVSADLLGPWQLFLLRCEDDGLSRCSRPKPVGPWPWRYVKAETALKEIAPGRLRLSFNPVALLQPSIMDGTAPIGREPAALPAPEIREIELDDIDRDSDVDGWTDLEEGTLGLDPARADSDGDGIDDAHDRAPLHAAIAARGDDAEEIAILRQAIFATFGVTESRWALFARDEKARRLEVPGLSAPLLFNRPLRAGPLKEAPGGVFVRWKIVRKTATDAIVEISDWEGPLAAGGQDVFLRRIRGEWIVVARQTSWIS